MLVERDLKVPMSIDPDGIVRRDLLSAPAYAFA